MNRPASRPGPLHRRPARGFVLVVCLLMLVVMSLLSVGVFRAANNQERLAGNTREKQRALQAAESALQYAEDWLRTNPSVVSGTTCAGVVDFTAAGGMRICTAAIATPTVVPWTVGTKYLPSYMTVAAGGGLTSTGDVNYAAQPMFHIQALGSSPGGSGLLYKVTALGHGGDIATVAVIESVLERGAGTATGLSGL
ncbi:Pilus assembly protein PilX [Burkholderiales bacterium 8X]|nr:Pilus assembly protein PilX [Burkholderiales bacterium 8X]